MKFPKVCFLIALFVLVGTTLFAADYRLQPGDILEVQVIGKRDLTTKQPISPDGTVALPFAGRIYVQGKTLPEMDALLKDKIGRLVSGSEVIVVLEKMNKEKELDPSKIIFIALHDLGKDTVEIKKTENPVEALAYTASLQFTVKRANVELGATTNILAGDIVTVKIGKRPDFIEDNWYKLLSGAGLALGILNSIKK